MEMKEDEKIELETKILFDKHPAFRFFFVLRIFGHKSIMASMNQKLCYRVKFIHKKKPH